MSGELQPRPDWEPNKETENLYVRTTRFDNDQESLRVFTRIQAILFGSKEDLSGYRLRYQNIPHVVVLGLKPEPEVDLQIIDILSAGKITELPQDIITTLLDRRYRAKRVGPWVERHYRPGKPF